MAMLLVLLVLSVRLFAWDVHNFHFRQLFCDFGKEFTVYDTNGEQPISNMIAAVTKVLMIL